MSHHHAPVPTAPTVVHQPMRTITPAPATHNLPAAPTQHWWSLEPDWAKIETTSAYALSVGTLLLALLHSQPLTPKLKNVLSVSVVLLLGYGLVITSWAKLRMQKEHELGKTDASHDWMLWISVLGGLLVVAGAAYILMLSGKDKTENIPLFGDNTWAVWVGLIAWLTPLLSNGWMKE